MVQWGSWGRGTQEDLLRDPVFLGSIGPPKVSSKSERKKVICAKTNSCATNTKAVQVPRVSVVLITLYEMVTNVNFSSKQLQQFSQVYLNSLFQLMNIARVRELKEGFWLSTQKDAGRVYIVVFYGE